MMLKSVKNIFPLRFYFLFSKPRSWLDFCFTVGYDYVNDGLPVYSRTAERQLAPPIHLKEVELAMELAEDRFVWCVSVCVLPRQSLTDAGGGSQTVKAVLSGDVAVSLVPTEVRGKN